jgi:4-amino-4-deoxy-L-arabinose transferase-like glycosyltransferase
VKRVVLVLALALLIAKAVAAARLGLFGDEAFYWQCAQRLDWAYADHPFMTAGLVRVGTLLFGDTTFGVRAAFLALGALIPWLLWRLAQPLVGDRDGVAAVGIGLISLGLTFHGVLAIPDTPLQVFTLASLVAAQSALRTDSKRAWIVAGLCGALALTTHLRAVLLPAALGAFLLFTRTGRAKLRGPGPWLGLLALLPGLLPVLIHNLQLDWAPLRYQGQGRHGEGFSWNGLVEHVLGQIAVTSGPLWFAYLGAFGVAWKRARAGDAAAGLALAFTLVHIGPFLVLSPITDREHTTVLWTAVGFLPLTPFVVPTLRAWSAAGAAAWRRLCATALPACAALVVVVAMFELATHALGIDAFVDPFAGWAETAAATRERLPGAAAGSRPIVVADNYKLGAQLDFYLHDAADVFVLDHPKNREHGRQSQYALWRRDESGLAARAGADAVVVWERSETSSRERKTRRRTILAHFEATTESGELVQEFGDSRRQFKFFGGHGVLAIPKPVVTDDAPDDANDDGK